MNKLLKKIFIIFTLSISFMFGGCVNNNEEKDLETIFIYMCGSNLESKNQAATKNITEMLSRELPDGINIVIEAGGSKKWYLDEVDNKSISRLIIKDQSVHKVDKIKQANMGEEETLIDFLEWGIENYPSEKYGLIFWNHGNGGLGGVCNDENFSFDSLMLKEIEDALQSAVSKIGNKFDFVGCDACLMANFSTVGMLSKYSNYMFGSEEIEPSGGWNYKELLNIVNENPNIDTRELGIKLCDAYYHKSLSSKRSNIATMSCIDLNEFENFNNEFNSLMKILVDKSKTPSELKKVAYSAKNAVKFGGSTEKEGFSNLIDIGTFVDGIRDLDTKKFDDAYSKLIVSHVEGNQKTNATGLSIYYPLNVDEKELNSYFEICPSKNYITFLKNNFFNIPKETIKFDNSGYINSNNEFCVEINKDSIPYLLSTDFALLEYNLDDSNEILSKTLFGFDNDIWSEGNTIKSNLRGVWNSLNGKKLYNTVVELTDDYIIFDAPIRLNGVETNLRFSFNYDDDYATNGYYEILGAWNGIDKETNMSDKELITLNKNDVVEVYRPCSEISLSNNGTVVNLGSRNLYEVVDNTNDYEIVEDGLDGEALLYQYVITDIYGRKYYSDVAWFTMTKTREQINNSKKLNGVYAAKPTSVIPAEGKFIFYDELIKDIEEFEKVVNKIKTTRINNKESVDNTNIIKF